MMKKPCSECGTLVVISAKSRPEPKCQSCRRATWPTHCDQCSAPIPETGHSRTPRRRTRQCSSACAVKARRAAPGPCTDCGVITSKHKTSAGRFCETCAAEKLRDHAVNKNHRRRVATQVQFHDITGRDVRAMKRAATHCPIPGCGVEMVDAPYLPASKELDHKVPINVGGTHTRDNVRIICRGCNRARPLDGSDL